MGRPRAFPQGRVVAMQIKKVALVLSSLVVVGAASVLLQPVVAQAGPPPSQVLVVNQPAHAVPVSVQGTPSVNANILSMPTFELAPGTTLLTQDSTPVVEEAFVFSLTDNPNNYTSWVANEAMVL